MLKVQNNSEKCAEIYCNALAEPKFNIMCICGKSIAEYEAFCEHFYNEHLRETEKRIDQDQQQPPDDAEPANTDECLAEAQLVLLPAIDGEHDTLTGSQQETNPSTSRERKKPQNTCSYCGRSFRRRQLLDTHLNIHTGSKPHQCEMCGKQFRAVSTLMRHLRTHQERQQEQCQHCEKQFTHRSALLSHELRHTQQRRWACGSCDKCFYTRNQMDTHQRKLHDKSSAVASSSHLPFACELCGNSYRSASMLSTHRLKKHYRLAKYQCEQCDKKFVDAERLQQHQLIHTKKSDC
ncbi:hypothetical protein KR044_006344 [Drosophila immigrans]|nr:hypothetical protein KR044_006344 [Drosophila immigrans]